MAEQIKIKNKKKMIIIIAVALLLVVAIAISWVETFWYYVDKIKVCGETRGIEMGYAPTDMVVVVLWSKEDYGKIAIGEITVADFNHKNIESIRIGLNDLSSEVIYVHLKKSGVRKCKQMVLHLLSLPFVKSAGTM